MLYIARGSAEELARNRAINYIHVTHAHVSRTLVSAMCICTRAHERFVTCPAQKRVCSAYSTSERRILATSCSPAILSKG